MRYSVHSSGALSLQHERASIDHIRARTELLKIKAVLMQAQVRKLNAEAAMIEHSLHCLNS